MQFNASVSCAVPAFGICILVLLILAIIVIIIYVRHYRNKTKRWAPVDSKKDEEEGLLPDSSLSSPSKDKAVEEENKVPEVTFRHGNKQPADKKKSQPPEEDDEGRSEDDLSYKLSVAYWLT